MSDHLHPASLEAQTHALFSGPSTEVVNRIAAHVYELTEHGVVYSEGSPKVMIVPTPEGDKRLQIEVAEAYLEIEASKLWRGRRRSIIRGLEPGEMVSFNSRSGVLSFVKTQDGDNIMLRSLVDIDSGDRYVTPTAVSELLGMEHDHQARLMLTPTGELQFTKVSV